MSDRYDVFLIRDVLFKHLKTVKKYLLLFEDVDS